MYNMEEEFLEINSVKFDSEEFYYNISNYSEDTDDTGLVLSYKERKDSEPTEIIIYNAVVVRALRDFINQHILNE